MNVVVGLVIVLSVALVIALLAFIVTPQKQPTPAKKVAVPKLAQRQKTPTPEFKTTSNGGVFIPREIPRTISTVKVMTQESPDLVVGIVKKWLREK